MRHKSFTLFYALTGFTYSSTVLVSMGLFGPSDIYEWISMLRLTIESLVPWGRLAHIFFAIHGWVQGLQ